MELFAHFKMELPQMKLMNEVVFTKNIFTSSFSIIKKLKISTFFQKILFRGKTEFFQIYFTQKYDSLSCEYNRYFF